ncbi:alpha/beta fold hydrolase [Aliidiomarina sp. Khilg15.8]
MSQVVCFHSSQSSGAQWRPLLHSFKDQAHAFATPDLIGYGRAPQPLNVAAEDFRLADEVACLNQHTDVLTPRPLHLVGHSYGGALALKWAREHPQAVASVTLYEPVSFHVLGADDSARHEISEIAAQMDSLSEAEAAALFVDYWNYPGYFAALPERVRRTMIAQQPKVNADFAALLHEPAALHDYAAVTCPVLLLHGNHSPLSSRRVAALLGETLPNCLQQGVEGGHMAPLTDASRVIPLMTEFLNRHL